MHRALVIVLVHSRPRRLKPPPAGPSKSSRRLKLPPAGPSESSRRLKLPPAGSSESSRRLKLPHAGPSESSRRLKLPPAGPSESSRRLKLLEPQVKAADVLKSFPEFLTCRPQLKAVADTMHPWPQSQQTDEITAWRPRVKAAPCFLDMAIRGPSRRGRSISNWLRASIAEI